MPNRRAPWRRAASRLRSAVYRALSPFDRLARARSGILLPPAHLRREYYRTLSAEAFRRASRGAREELISRGLRPGHRLLDIGSGIGNLALGLVGYLEGGYDGVEIHPEAVAWCRAEVTARHPSFRFHHADLFSRAYNPRGRESASTYRFPFADGTFDFVFLGSVFTHMPPDAVARYLHEIGRVLAPGGCSVASYFLLNDETRAGVRAGRSFLSFGVDHASGLCLLHDASVPEAAVALDEDFVRRAHDEAGLEIRDARRGHWWDGHADDQDVLTAGRRV